MNKEMKSFRFTASSCMELEELSKKFKVSQSKIIESLVLMAYSDVFPRKNHENYMNIDDLEWFLKN